MKTTCSTVLRRTLGVAGFLIGFGLLSAGVASADDGDSTGLLGGVTGLLAPVTDAVAPVSQELTPVSKGVVGVADPVLKPVLKVARPVTEPVLAPLAPVVDTATRALSPVLEPLQPVTGPVLAPVVGAAQDVPVVPRLAEPLVTQPSTPADVPPAADISPPTAVPSALDAPPVLAVTAPEPRVALLPGRAAAGIVPQSQQISAPEMAPPNEVPFPPSPDVPLALPGTMGSVSSSGSTGSVVSDVPAAQGMRPGGESLAVITDHQVHGSWCYYYGRSHPS